MLRPTAEDHRIIATYTGRVIVGVGILMLLPLGTSLVFGEWSTAVDFGIGMSVCLAIGLALQAIFHTQNGLLRRHAFITVSTSWLAATVLGSIPYALSGHYASLLDCVFDVMSGFTTTGLYLLQDLDHVANGLNMWRFVLTFAGGQGIVVLALAFLFKGTPGTFSLSAGEGKEERLLPNIIGTARIIWLISLVWLIVGSTILTLLGLGLGQEPVRAVLHGLWVFMGAFSTGGFAPQSYNTIWYHSLAFEIACIVIFFAGSLNFAVHWAVWTKDRKEIIRNIETRSFAATLLVLTAVATFGLAKAGVYPDTMILFRKVFYQLMSAHTTTGFGTIYSRTFVTQWGPIAMLALIAAMVIGASSGSTAGGIKGLRVGIITRSFVQDIRKMVSPESAVIRTKYHHIKDVVLTDEIARGALNLTVAFLTMHAVVALVGVLSGYPLIEAMFDGVSAASNTGLSCGVISPAMPWGMKLVLTIAMWLGRMEFLAVFALAGWIWAVIRGR
jgi:trk system potassium uptake protein TrkH